MLTDLRRAGRALARAPGFTAVAILTLALGIGATTAIFSVVHGVLLKPLPYAGSERLVSLRHRAPGANLPLVHQGEPTYFTYLDHQRVFDAIGGWDARQVSITGRGEPERVEAVAVTGIALGVLASLALTRLMSALLFGVAPTDLPTYAAVSLGLAGVAVLAAWLPARRASRLDPAVALRTSA